MNHYTSIDDMPILNWRKINETNDLKWMFPNGKGVVTTENKLALSLAFEKIKNEFIDTFGVGADFKRIMQIKIEIARWKIRMALEQDSSHINFIEVLEIELNKILSEAAGKNGFSQLKAHLDRFMGFRILEKRVSIKDFYNYVELMKESKQAA